MSLLFRSNRAASGGGQRRGVTTGDVLAEAWAQRTGGGKLAAPVTFDSAQTISAVWACLRLRASLVSTMPVHLLRGSGADLVDVPKPPVLVSPGGSDMKMREWLAAGQRSLDLRGNNYGIVVERDGLLLPRAIQLQHPDTVGCRWGKDGHREYTVNGRPVDTADVWHQRANVVAGSPTGLSPIRFAARTLGMTIGAEQFGSDFFRDGGHPTGLLTNSGMTEIEQPAAQVVKDRFVAATQGSREPAVLGNGWKYEQLQIAPDESQFLETMRFDNAQIARFFGLDPQMIGGSDGGASITYASLEARGQHFLTFGFGADVEAWQDDLSTLTPKPQFVRLGTGALLRADISTRYKAHEIAIRNKWMTPDEARGLEDMPPLTPEQVATLQSLAATPAPIPVVQEAP